MNKGFTLMEILAVMLVIAVIASFALPVVRSVRAEVYYQRAKTAGIKMAEAIRSYYRDSKGHLPTGTIDLGNVPICNRNYLSGIPGQRESVGVNQLLSCGYLSAKDFVGLPYTFTVGLPDSLVVVRGKDDKAGRYKNEGFAVDLNMGITETKTFDD